MKSQLEPSIVRILTSDGAAVGGGFLVANNTVLTCAHVINAALGIPLTTAEIPTLSVHLDFPLVAPTQLCSASVTIWKPVQPLSFGLIEDGEDIAILQLDTPSPHEAQPVHPVVVDHLWGHRFRTFGLPEGYQDGIWADGILQSKRANGWIQMKDVNVPGLFVESGFSGMPVWDEEVESIVGMVVATISSSEKKTAFMIPASALIKAHPTLNEYIVDDLKIYLKKVRDTLSRLPSYYPQGFTFENIRQRVRVSHKRLLFDEESIELNHQKSSIEREAEQVYKRRGIEMYQQLQEGDEAVVVDWEDLRTKIKRGVILGDPGFGKSWLLRYEGWRRAQEQLAYLERESSERGEVFIPVYIRLGTLAQELSQQMHGEDVYICILNILKRDYHLPEHFLSQIQHWVDNSRAVLLLDALDEVPIEQRNLLREGIKKLAENTSCSILLTSRLVGYQHVPFELDGEGTRQELELVTFDKEQIADFIQSWFTSRDDKAEYLLTLLDREPVLHSLARIPLLLSFLCLVITHNENLPVGRVKLYEIILHRLLEASWREQLLQEERKHRIESKLTALEQIAWYFAQYDGQWYDLLPANLLYRRVQQCGYNEQLVWELSEQDGIFVKAGEPAAGKAESQVPFLFLHRTIHEYLVARYLAHQTPDIWIPQVKEHLWFDSDWEVVILLLAGSLKDPNPLLEMLLNEPYDAFHTMLLLAGRCLIEIDRSRVNKRLLQELIEPLLALHQSASPREWRRAMQILEQLDDHYTQEILSAISISEKSKLSLAAGLVETQQKNLRALKSLLSATQHEGPEVCVAATRIIELFKNEETLKDILTGSQTKGVSTERALESVLIRQDHEIARDLLTISRSEKAETRYGAVRLLRHVRDQQIVEGLLTASYDEDHGVRQEAKKALRNFERWQRSVEEQIEVLRNGEVPVRWQRIAKRIKLLPDDKFYVRCTAAGMLGSLGGARAEEALLDALQDKEPSVRQSAVAALGSIGSRQAIKGLLAIFGDEAVGKDSRRALERLGGQQTIEGLLSVLQDPDQNITVRHQAAEALGRIGNQQAVAGLLATLHDESVRRQVGEALAGLQSQSTIEGLLSALQDEDMEVRCLVAQVLGQLENQQAVSGLLVAIEDTEKCVRYAATKALGQLKDQRAKGGLLLIFRDENEPRFSRWEAAALLGQLGGSSSLHSSLATTRQRNNSLRTKELRKHFQTKDQEAVEDLFAGLQDKNPSVRLRAAKALLYLGEYQIVPELLRDSSEGLRRGILDTLAAIGSKQFIEYFFPALWNEGLSFWSARLITTLAQDYDTVYMCYYILSAWLYKYNRNMGHDIVFDRLYEILVQLNPHLYKTVKKEEDVWRAWRACLTSLTHFMLPRNYRWSIWVYKIIFVYRILLWHPPGWQYVLFPRYKT